MDSNTEKVRLSNEIDFVKACAALPHFNHIVNGDKITISCPYHVDEHPSAFISQESRQFYCSSCQRKGYAIIALIHYAMLRNICASEREALVFFTRFTKQSRVDLSFVEQYHKLLMDATENFRADIYAKGLTEDLLRKHRIGMHANKTEMRYTIPIFALDGSCIQVLSYLPNAIERKFFVLDVDNAKRGRKQKSQLFGVDQLQYKQIVICGGPLKAILAQQELNQHGIGAISFTTGEGAIPEQYRGMLTGHIIYVCYDIDTAGERGASKALQSLVRYASGLYKIVLPLDIAKYPKGDITDYVTVEKKTLLPLIEHAIPYEAILPKNVLPQDVVPITYSQLVSGTHPVNMVYQTDVKSIGHIEQGIKFISEVTVECSRDESCCGECPVYAQLPEKVYGIEPDHPKQITVAFGQEKLKADAFRGMVNIPSSCRSSKFYPVSTLSAFEHTFTNIQTASEYSKTCKGYFIKNTPSKNDLFLNITCRDVSGAGIPEQTLLITEFEKSKLSMAVELSDSELDDLRCIIPKAWTIDALHDWYAMRYSYLESLHRIFGRSKMNFLIDLVFHSVLNFNFNGMQLNGWATLLILGDTGTGKSTMLNKLFDLYKVGDFRRQAVGSRAGWIGGMEKSRNGKQQYRPGAFPSNDGGLLCIEELKSLDATILQTFLTSMSEGQITATFIQDTQSLARVRLIFTSNTRYTHTLYSTPRVRLLADLLGTEEALRRFDCGYAALKDSKFLEPLAVQTCNYGEQHLANLVRFAWTAEKVEFDQDAVEAIFAVSKHFSERYQHDTILLVDSSSQHNKFARLAVALACLTFSYDGVVIVRKCHVDFVAGILQQIYDGEEMGYRTFVEQEQRFNSAINPDRVATLREGMYWLQLVAVLNSLSGQFDSNAFYVTFSDRQVAVGLFASCQELGFIRTLPDNKHYTVTERWRRYNRETILQCNVD